MAKGRIFSITDDIVFHYQLHNIIKGRINYSDEKVLQAKILEKKIPGANLTFNLAVSF